MVGALEHQAGGRELEAGGAGNRGLVAACRVRNLTAPGALLLLAILAAACSPSEAAATPVLPELQPVPIPSALPVPTAMTAVAEALTPTVEPRGPCADGARFIEDLSVPDGSEVFPGSEIDKRWSVENVGSCDWGAGYRLVRVSADALGGPDEIALYPARAGTRAIWQVVFAAPDSLGEAISEWQAQAPDGTRFGDEVFVYVIVVPPLTPTASPLPGG